MPYGTLAVGPVVIYQGSAHYITIDLFHKELSTASMAAFIERAGPLGVSL